MTSVQVFYEGKVQGVGFRWTVRHIATGFEVTGWVRNLPDGRVELQVGGDENEVRAFLEAVKQSELRGLIRQQTESALAEPAPSNEYACLRVERCALNVRLRMTSVQVFYEGKVQGVGFRWTVRHIATGFEVTGWVRNLPDGRVELQVGGDANEVRAFLEAVKQSELRGLIRQQTESALAE